MGRALSTVLVLGALVALVWTASSVNLGGRTAFGHIIARCKTSDALRSMVAWTKRRFERGETAKSEGPRPAPKAKPSGAQGAATPRRVALLEHAQKELLRGTPKSTAAGRAVSGPNEKKPSQRGLKTRIDERISPRHKKSLDELVSSRVARN